MVSSRLHVAVVVVAITALGAGRAHADEARAKRLFLSGTAKYDKGNYEGALADFEGAYKALPRPKILLNIGATHLKLNDRPEAANYFSKFIEQENADNKRVEQVEAELEALDRQLGKLRLDVRIDGGTVSVDGKELGASPLAKVMRVEPGDHTVHVAVAADGWEKTWPVVAAAGESLGVILDRETASVPVQAVGGVTDGPGPESTTVTKGVEPADSGPGSFGVFVRTDVDAKGRGAVFAPGVSYALTSDIDAFASGLAGGNFGAEVGARMGFGPWKLRPVVSVAVPLFFDGGARPGARGAVGAVWSVGRFEASVDIGGAYAFSVPQDHVKTVVLASAGVGMRL